MYNKWFITVEKKNWSIDLAEKVKEKFKVEARMIYNKVLGYEDILLDFHARLSKDIICVIDGTMVVFVVGMISRA